MFKFIRSKLGAVAAVKETQRQTLERALAEVNEVVALMADKPKVTFDPVSGGFSLELPDQMPDEALALPAPSEDEVEQDTVESKDAA